MFENAGAFFGASAKKRAYYGALVVWLLVWLPSQLLAQSSGSVVGRLLDRSTQQPLPFGNVLLLRAQDSTVVVGVQSAEDGGFKLAGVGAGAYVLQVVALGYAPTRQRVVLTAATPVLQLGTLSVAPLVVQLGGVVVQGEQAAMVTDLDKKIINVAKDLNSVGGTAADVLQKVPSVAVDPDGQVSLRGVGATIYIDGKPAPSSLRLDQLPASRLATIEVITNPSARYSAQGAGGILNLVLKKETQDGWNGQATGTLGTRRKYTGSLSLNRKMGKLNLYGNYDARSNRFYGSAWLRQTAEAEGRTTRTDQQARNVRAGRHQSIRLGVDYAFSDHESVTFSAETNPRSARETENLTTVLTRDSDAPITLENQNTVAENLYNGRAAASYRRTWPQQKGRELTANTQLIWDGGQVLVGQRVLAAPTSYPLQARRQDLNVDILMPSGQLDYAQPLGENRRVEVGLKAEALLTTGQAYYLLRGPGAPEFVEQPGLSSSYRYRQYVPAGYVNYQQTLGKWSYQAGLRAEHTTLRGRVAETLDFKQQYLNLFPSATVRRALPGDQHLQLSYSRRLNRPNFLQIVALPIYADARNYKVGNPTLRPEYSHVVELGHQVTWNETTTLTSTLFGRFTQHSIQSLREIDTLATRLNGQPDFVTRTSYRNFGPTANYGLELSVSRPLAKWWNVVVNGSFYYNQLASYAGYSTRSNFTGTAYLLNTFTITKHLDAQLSGNYRGPQLLAQGRIAAQYGIDAALRQRLLHNRAALTLRLSDVFNTRRQRTLIYADGLTSDFQTKLETRIGYLGFTWFLGGKKVANKIENQPQGDTGSFND